MITTKTRKLFLTTTILLSSIIFTQLYSNNEYDSLRNTTDVSLQGDVRFEIGNWAIQSDEMIYNQDKKQTTLIGNVKIANNNFFATCDEAGYDSVTEKIFAKNCIIKTGPLFLKIAECNFANLNQQGYNVNISLGENLNNALNIDAKNIIIRDNKIAYIKKAIIKVGSIPVFYVPEMSFKLKKSPIALNVNTGYSKALGGYLQTKTSIQMTENLKTGMLFDVYTNRGALIGPTLQYNSDNTNNQIESSLSFGYINDKGKKSERGTDVNKNNINSRRYLGKFEHKQHINNKIDIISKATLLSDSEFEHDFMRADYDEDNIPLSYSEISYRSENFITSLYSNVQLNRFYTVNERMPELRIAYLPTEIKSTGIYQNGFLSHAHIRQKKHNDKIYSQIDRTEVFYQLEKPFHYEEWLTFKPLAGIRITEFSSTNNSRKDYTRFVVQVGFDLTTNFYHIYDYKNDLWQINQIKHIIAPTIQYRYMPKANAGYDKIKQIQPNIDIDFMSNLELRDMRNVDDLASQNIFRLGLSNTLQTKNKNDESRDLFQFNVFQDVLMDTHFNKKEHTKEHTLNQTHIMSSVDPIYWLSFKFYNKLQTRNMSMLELKTLTKIKSGDAWNMYFETKAKKNKKNKFDVGFEIKLNSKSSFKTDITYDARVKKFTEQEFIFHTTVNQYWNIDYCVTLRSKASRDNKFQFDIKLGLVRF